MNLLNKKLIKDLLQTKAQFISILVVVVIGVMFYSGVNSTFMNLLNTSEKYYSDYRFGDIWADVIKAPANIEDKLNYLPYVKMSTGRIIEDLNLSGRDDNATIRVITLPDNKKDIVNDIEINSGRYFSGSTNNKCLIEERFFEANELNLGDSIYPVVNGSPVRLVITGTIRSPEFVYTVKDGCELLPDNKKFGIVFVKKSFGEALLGYHGSINNISLLLKSDINIDEVKDDIKEQLKDFGVSNIYKREDQISNKMLSEEMKGLQSVGAAFPLVFFLVAAIIIYITTGRMVENQKTQIGVLKAFGFSDIQVLMHYMGYAVIIAVLGSIIGSVSGMLLGKGMTDLLNVYFNLPTTEMKLYPEYALPASALTLIFCMTASYNSCKKVFRIMPSEAMRPKSPPIGRQVILEKITLIWNSINYVWKMVIRNISRYKKRVLLTSIGVIFASAITFVSLGMNDSVNYLIDQQYMNIQDYDIKVNFKGFLSVEELKIIGFLKHIEEYEPVLETAVEFSNGWRKKDSAFYALINEPEIFKVVDKAGDPRIVPDHGVLISERLARELGVEVNDMVHIKSYLPGKEKKELPVEGIIAQYLGSGSYTSLKGFDYIAGEGKIANSAVIRLDKAENENYVINELRKMPMVSSAQSKSESKNNLAENMAAMTGSIAALILMASVLSFAVIYNMSSINIHERKKELAILKVLGFLNKEVNKVIFYENYLITIIGIALGLPFGMWLGDYMMKMYETDAYTFPFTVYTKTYFIAGGLIIGFTLITNLILVKKIRDIDLVEALKSNE